ncbi:hypothetical protein Cgig2_005922 [Carnegiea gigantea]|uniref:Uncharacterized protein n=1 Tax=Carnegiea gigantea TaxID=171969 RepID=A0A9Q1JVT8_9CARY|nr:hypothetical protein Cgig2_005922 [Carnegiea gigantea]
MYDPQDRDTLIQLETIAVKGGLITLRRRPADKAMSQWCFNDTVLWVQIQNFPLLDHNSTNALGLPQLIGEPINAGFQGESRSPNYGSAPIYRHYKGPLDSDISSNKCDGGTGPFNGSMASSKPAAGPSFPTGAPHSCFSSSNSATSKKGYRGKSSHEHPTAHGPQGHASMETEVLDLPNVYL